MATVLIAKHRATLHEAERLAVESEAPTVRFTLERIRAERSRLDGYEGYIAAGAFMRESGAEHVLAMLGRNGRGPAIADVLREARGLSNPITKHIGKEAA